MQYLYTSKSDETNHPIYGVFGRPVHNYEVGKLLAKGWVRRVEELSNESTKESTKEESTKEVTSEVKLSIPEQAKLLGIETEDKHGKTLHWKVLAKKIEAHNVAN